MLRNRMTELAGLVTIALGVALALALITFNPADPSANTDSGNSATNIIGIPGEYGVTGRTSLRIEFPVHI